MCRGVLINAAVTGRLSTLSLPLFVGEERRRGEEEFIKTQLNRSTSATMSRQSPCHRRLCSPATARDTLRVRGAVCFVSSHYITNELPSGGGRGRETARQTEKERRGGKRVRRGQE